MQLMTAESIAKFEVCDWENAVPGFAVHFGTADVKDCFHRLRTPPWMWEYFTLPAVPAKLLNVTGVLWGGEVLEADSLVIPAWGVLPMGFNWSLYFAEDINSERAAHSMGAAAGSAVHDRGPPLLIQPRPGALREHFVYVGNLGVLTSSDQESRGVVEKW